jgi:uncharacterized protein YdaU (DUF1376 family)
MSSRPFFKFFVGDYLQDTMGLSCCEHGVYMLLLAASWKRGPLPDDMDHVARLAANPPIEALRFILNEYWTLTERGWINARLERERAEVDDIIEKRRLAGQRGADARWQTHSKGMANASQTHGKRMAKGMAKRCQSESESEPEEDIEHTSYASPQSAADAGSGGPARCPHRDIVELYHQTLPMLPKVRSWTGNRQRMLGARWREDAERQSLDWWRGFFEYIAESPFLTGRAQNGNRPPFVADLEWIVRPQNFAKIDEGRYHR